MLGVYLQILEFVLTFHARLESVGLIYSLSRVVVVHILKLLTVEKFQTSNTRKKIGYLYQGVYVAMGSMDFILIKHNGNYKMEKPAIYMYKKKPNTLSSCLQNRNKIYSCYDFRCFVEIYSESFHAL